MAKTFIFQGTFTRCEMGKVEVTAESVDEAKALVVHGGWCEVWADGGETTFEWDGTEPKED